MKIEQIETTPLELPYRKPLITAANRFVIAHGLLVKVVARNGVSGLRYFRLHGIGGYKSRYSDSDLDRLAAWCRIDSYVMFNNITMAQDALGFRSRWG